MKIKEYPKANSLATGDRFIVDNDDDGTRYIEQTDLPWGEGGSVPESDPVWVSHRNTYRGKPLGNLFTDEQKQAISSGTFNDLYVGDYWTINNIEWLIADINYWLRTGSAQSNGAELTNHLVVVPRKGLYKTSYNDTDTVSGGYIGSKIRTAGLNQAKTMIESIFGTDYIYKHRGLFVNASIDGIGSGITWVESTVDLMSQIMLYGTAIFSTEIPGKATSNYTIDKEQLALFRLRPEMIIDVDSMVWTRDIIFGSRVTAIDSGGNSTANNPSYANAAVRPVFGLTGGN